MKSEKELRCEIQQHWDELQSIKPALDDGKEWALVKSGELLRKLDKLKKEFEIVQKENDFAPLMEETNEDRKIIQEPINNGSGNPQYTDRTRKKLTYRNLFGAGNTSDFSTLNEFMRAVNRGSDPRLVPSNDALEPSISIPLLSGNKSKRAMSQEPLSTGGFLIPDEFGAMLLDKTLENSIVLSRAQVKPMKTATKIFPAWGIGSHENNLYDGVIAYFIGEGGSYTETSPGTRSVEMRAKKLGIYTQVNDELLEDSADFENDLQDVLTKSLEFYIDYFLIQGLGAKQPIGIINSPSLVSQAAEIGQSQDTIAYENLKKMYSRMLPGSRKNAVWIANDDCLPELLELTIPIGTGGAHIPLVKENGGEMKIFNRPLLLSEKMNKLGDVNDIVFVDLTQYIVGLRYGLMLAKSNEVGFSSGKTVFRLTARFDGKMIMDEALTPKKSTSKTLSSIVGLAERA